MPISWGLIALGSFVQATVGVFHQPKVGKGKLTRLHARLFRKTSMKPADFRFFWQLMPLLIVELSLIWMPKQQFDRVVGTYWLIVIVLYMDDYLFGDNDKWKRRWAAVKNKVKWLWTPQMEPDYQRGE